MKAWDAIQDNIPRGPGYCLIELIPANEATRRFHQRHSKIIYKNFAVSMNFSLPSYHFDENLQERGITYLHSFFFEK